MKIADEHPELPGCNVRALRRMVAREFISESEITAQLQVRERPKVGPWSDSKLQKVLPSEKNWCLKRSEA